MEVKPARTAYFDDLPTLDPILAHEITSEGWRGLTEGGEIFEVKGRDGVKPTPPDDELLVMRAGQPVGIRKMLKGDINIDRYLEHFNRAAKLFRRNEVDEAIMEADASLAIAPTLHARYNRAFMLLSAGRWDEGFAEYVACESGPPFQRPVCKRALEAGLKPWRGELLGSLKRLLVVHAHGFGDTIMTLRYVARLRLHDADVVMHVPPELVRLVSTIGPVSANSLEIAPADYFCPFLMLPYGCGDETPDQILRNVRLPVDLALREKWIELLPPARKRIGVAWSVGKFHDGDYPREIPLATLVAAFPDAELHSVQLQGAEEAMALGVKVHALEDFADCAALMSVMDAIVTVDTAAAHLAGAIEHPSVFLLTSYWASWRWLAPWYPTMRVCRQRSPGDWASALGQIHDLGNGHRLD